MGFDPGRGYPYDLMLCSMGSETTNLGDMK
jgi:hypothetical protein